MHGVNACKQAHKLHRICGGSARRSGGNLGITSLKQTAGAAKQQQQAAAKPAAAKARLPAEQIPTSTNRWMVSRYSSSLSVASTQKMKYSPAYRRYTTLNVLYCSRVVGQGRRGQQRGSAARGTAPDRAPTRTPRAAALATAAGATHLQEVGELGVAVHDEAVHLVLRQMQSAASSWAGAQGVGAEGAAAPQV